MSKYQEAMKALTRQKEFRLRKFSEVKEPLIKLTIDHAKEHLLQMSPADTKRLEHKQAEEMGLVRSTLYQQSKAALEQFQCQEKKDVKKVHQEHATNESLLFRDCQHKVNDLKEKLDLDRKCMNEAQLGESIALHGGHLTVQTEFLESVEESVTADDYEKLCVTSRQHQDSMMMDRQSHLHSRHRESQVHESTDKRGNIIHSARWDGMLPRDLYDWDAKVAAPLGAPTAVKEHMKLILEAQETRADVEGDGSNIGDLLPGILVIGRGSVKNPYKQLVGGFTLFASCVHKSDSRQVSRLYVNAHCTFDTDLVDRLRDSLRECVARARVERPVQGVDNRECSVQGAGAQWCQSPDAEREGKALRQLVEGCGLPIRNGNVAFINEFTMS